MNKDLSKMNSKSVFKIINTRRYTEKGLEYNVYFKLHFPSTFVKYFDIGLVNSIEIDLHDKKKITLYVAEQQDHNIAVQQISNCCQNLLNNHLYIQDAIIGDSLIEKGSIGSGDGFMDHKSFNVVRSLDDIENDIFDVTESLEIAVNKENYEKAAKLRDQLQKLNEEKAKK